LKTECAGTIFNKRLHDLKAKASSCSNIAVVERVPQKLTTEKKQWIGEVGEGAKIGQDQRCACEAAVDLNRAHDRLHRQGHWGRVRIVMAAE